MALTPIYQLKSFVDLYTAVREELKIQATDNVAINRIKRDLNIVYIDEVVPFAQWKWLRGNLESTVYAAIIAGTASVVQNSNTVTLTVPIAASRKGFWFGIVGYSEVYRVAAHNSNTGTLVLEVPYTGVTNASAQYKIWTDEIYLPSFVRETFQITHDFNDTPLENCGLQKYRQYVASLPRAEGRPYFYTTDRYYDPMSYVLPIGLPAISTRASDTITKTVVFASDVSNYLQQGDRIEVSFAGDATYNGQFVVSSQSGATITYTGTVSIFENAIADTAMIIKKLQPASDARRAKRILVYPAIYNQNTTLHIDYIREVIPMADDTDEPLMPIGDRTILLYGALQRAWSRERNPEEAKRNQDLFDKKLIRMAGKMDDSIDQPKLIPSKIYLGAKRMAQRQKDTRNGLPEGWGGGTSGGQVITGTASKAAIFDSTGSLTASTVSTTELGRLSGILSKADGISDTNTLTNKTLLDSSNVFANVTDSSKKFKVSLGGQSTNTTSTVSFISSVSRTYTFPDITDTVVTLSATQTLTNKTLSNLGGTLLDGTGSTAISVVNAVDNTKVNRWNLSGATAGTTTTFVLNQTQNRNITFPDVTDTLCAIASSQTLTNKTINAGSNVVSGITVNMMASTGVGATRVPMTDGSGNVNWQKINAQSISSSGASANLVLTADGSGNSTFQSVGNTISLVTKTANYIVTSSDDQVQADTTSSAFTLFLQPQSSGKQVIFDYIGTSYTNILNISCSACNMEGSTATQLRTPGETLRVVFDGTNYRIQQRFIPNMWTTFTMTPQATTNPSKGTVLVDLAQWRRYGDEMEIMWQYAQGAAGGDGSGTYVLPIPLNLQADPSKATIDTNQKDSWCGTGFASATNTNVDDVSVFLTNSTGFSMAYRTSFASSLAAVGSANYGLAGSSASYAIRMRVPILGWKGWV